MTKKELMVSIGALAATYLTMAGIAAIVEDNNNKVEKLERKVNHIEDVHYELLHRVTQMEVDNELRDYYNEENVKED